MCRMGGNWQSISVLEFFLGRFLTCSLLALSFDSFIFAVPGKIGDTQSGSLL